MRMKLGAMTNPALELIPQIHWIGKNGFDFVDLALEPPLAAPMDIEKEALVSALRGHHLGVIVHTSPHLPVANLHRAVRETAKREMSLALQFAVNVGSPLMTLHYLGGPAPYTSEMVLDLYVHLLEALCREAEEVGVKGGLGRGWSG